MARSNLVRNLESAPRPVVRDVSRVVRSHRQHEGAGFIVRRPIPGVELPFVDPFLLIDELGPVDYAPGEAIGAPDHPHRGFETVSYVLEGEVEHEDSAGHRGLLGPGDVQWMTAGGGIVHSEMPSRRLQEEGGRVHGFQIWVNLPARLKMSRPRYQEVPRARVPEGRTADGRARVRVVAGEALGAKAVIDTLTPVVFQDWTLERGADVTVPIDSEQRVLLFVFEGEMQVGDGGRAVKDGELAILGAGDSVRLRAKDDAARPARVLLLAGKPLDEPVARHGPFVMNTEREIIEAILDFQSGKLGEITRTAKID